MRARQVGEQRVVTEALLLRLSIYRMRGEFERAREMISELEPRRRGLPPGNINFASLQSEQSLIAQARSDRRTALGLGNQALGIAEASAKSGQQGSDLVPPCWCAGPISSGRSSNRRRQRRTPGGL